MDTEPNTVTIQLIYRSQRAYQLSSDDVTDILKTARRHNSDKQITGFLLYDGLDFVQLLEGPVSVVDSLYTNIKADPRHKNLQLLSRQAGQERACSDWSMAYAFVDGQSCQRFGGIMSDSSVAAVADLIGRERSDALDLIAEMLQNVSNPLKVA